MTDYEFNVTTVITHLTSLDPNGAVAFDGDLSSGEQYISFEKYRSWVRSSRPYIHTQPYHVTRWDAVPCNFVYVDEGNHIVGNFWDRTLTGNFLPVLRDGIAPSLSYSEVSAVIGEQLALARNTVFDGLAEEVWNAPVFFAELHKTTELVSTFAQKVDKSARFLLSSAVDIRKRPVKVWKKLKSILGDYARGFKVPNGVTSDSAKLWLQWRYAVNTGVMDIEQAARTTASLLVDKSNRTVTRVTRNRHIELTLAPLSSSDGETGRFIGVGLSLGENVQHYLSRNVHVHAKAWVTARAENSVLTDANQLGLLNAPSFVWELIPLSFVADWILGVGDFLSRCTAACGYVIIDAGTSVFQRISGSHSVQVLPMYKYDSRDYTAGQTSEYSLSYYNRDVWLDPSPTWTPKLRMATNRWIDAAALIRQIPLGRFKIA